MRDLHMVVEAGMVDVAVTADEMVDVTEEIDLEVVLQEEAEVVIEAVEIEDHVTIQMIEKIVVDGNHVIGLQVNQDPALDPDNIHDPNPDKQFSQTALYTE